MDPNLDPSYQRLVGIDWCAELINNPDYRVAIISPDPRVDVVMGQTLRTEDCLRAMLCLYKVHKEQIRETLMLFDIGHGLNGLPGVVHGGIVAALLDCACSLSVGGAFGPLADSLLQATDKNRCAGIRPDMFAATLYLNVTYLKYVKAPSVIAIRTRFKKRQGRKVFIENQMEDKDRNILAKADVLFILRPQSKM